MKGQDDIMRRSKLGWSLVLTFSIVCLIGYGIWSFNFVKNNWIFAHSYNNIGTIENSATTSTSNKNIRDYKNFGGMMSGYGMMGGYEFQNGTTALSYLNEDTATKQMKNSLKGATVDKKNNTITFSGKDITIVMLGGPETADGKFVVGGLINPTIQVPKDATISLEMINEDEEMLHGVEITNANPPYFYMTMMQGGIYNANSVVSPLPPASNDNYPSAVTTFTADGNGTFYYICQYPGHAAKGMYGKFIVK